MQPFAFAPAADLSDAAMRAEKGAEWIAGGTDMLQLLQEGVRRPDTILDITLLPLAGIQQEQDGALRLGALTTLQDAADTDVLRRRFPVVAEALDATASPMVRHMATIGGNLLQRTRCLYFRDVTTPCNKREPGSGCSARDGENRINAILGGSEHCIAVQPSDLPVALVAVDAEVLLRRTDGAEHWIAVEEFYRSPGDTPHIETVLEPGDLILAVRIPASAAARRSHYVKVRDRASFSWALASCAVSLRMEADGTVVHASLAAGGVATRPWRLTQVEKVLIGQRLDTALISIAAQEATAGSAPLPGNTYKVPLLRNTVERALLEIGGLA
ncbi:MAG: xanthine dehydrogenase family protein subunit M [Gammaproteobacteria bacterium]